MNRRDVLKAAAALTLPLILPAGVQARRPGGVKKIAFGSCAKQYLPQPVWASILQASPDIFVHLGDAVYTEPSVEQTHGIIGALQRAYDQQSKVESFQALRKSVHCLPTWDDHDYGAKDGDGTFSRKFEAKQAFLDFWQVDAQDLRRTQKTGIYFSEMHAVEQDRLQLIVLDTRFNRSPLAKASAQHMPIRHSLSLGPYQPLGKDAKLLGQAQWSWLEAQLALPATLRIICTSIQFSASFRGWDSWENYPHEKQKMVALIEKTNANGVIFISGDVHYGEISCETRNTPYPLFDITSSGLTHFWPTPGPNANRLNKQSLAERNFGLLRLNCENQKLVSVGASVKGIDGQSELSANIPLEMLKSVKIG